MQAAKAVVTLYICPDSVEPSLLPDLRRPNKNCVYGNRSENFRYAHFLGKKIIFCIWPFKMHKIIFFPENLKKSTVGFTSKFKSLVTLNTGIFFIWPKYQNPVHWPTYIYHIIFFDLILYVP